MTGHRGVFKADMPGTIDHLRKEVIQRCCGFNVRTSALYNIKIRHINSGRAPWL